MNILVFDTETVGVITQKLAIFRLFCIGENEKEIQQYDKCKYAKNDI